MRISGSAILALVLLLFAAQSGYAQQPSETVVHMREHLAKLEAIKAALLVGELGNAREPATWLAEHEPLEGLALIYEPFVLSMRDHARDVINAKTVESATMAMAAIANECGNCHRATQTVPRFPDYGVPSGEDDLKTHMQRHEWAVLRLWEGLIGPSDVAWSRGIQMLAEAPLLGTENTWGESDEVVGDALASRVHELGVEAIEALTPATRGDVYATMVATCAACHVRTGGGPRSY